MFCASPPSPPTANGAPGSTTLERRLASEWALLHRLAECNPDRLTNLSAEDLSFTMRLRETPALALAGEGRPDAVLTDHTLRLEFPRFFPTAPMELFLHTPVQHPNIHPRSGFVCLWERHRVSHTTEHALLKLAAMLGWRLANPAALHVMQPDALRRWATCNKEVAAFLVAKPLQCATSVEFLPDRAPSGVRRRRLS